MISDRWHQSQRGYFAGALLEEMKTDKGIYVLTGDLGYGMWDKVRDNFSDRFINVGASEQSLLDISVGLAMEGKKPFAFSITPFLIYRGFETIRDYINHENIPVRLVGSGRDDDYKHDGFSHNAGDVKGFLDQFSNIKQFWPEQKEYISSIVQDMVENNRPSFISLRR